MPTRKSSHFRSRLVKVVVFFCVWRLGLFVVSFSADHFFRYQPEFPYTEVLTRTTFPRWLYSWASFDGVHYLRVAEHGYLGTALVQAFFPLYPYVLTHIPYEALSHKISLLLWGMVVSNAAAVALCAAWYWFVYKLVQPKYAWSAVLALFLFPTAFFFGAYYTESLFLLLVIGSLIAAQGRRWWLVAVLVSLATATRLVGICLLPALLVEIYLQDRERFHSASLQAFLSRNWQSLLWVSAGATGLAAYMCYLQLTFHDPLYFLDVQPAFGGGRSTTLTLYPQVVWRYLKILLTTPPVSLRYIALLEEAAAGILGLIAILWSAKYVRLSIVTLSLGAFLIPTFTGTFSSMPRYILPCLSIFLLLPIAFEKWPRFKWAWLVGSTFLLVLNTMLFIQGYWIA